MSARARAALDPLARSLLRSFLTMLAAARGTSRPQQVAIYLNDTEKAFVVLTRW